MENDKMKTMHPNSAADARTTEEFLEALVRVALQLGATDARVVPPDAIVVQEAFADCCREPRCPNYGLSPSCPPHVEGPAGFRDLQKTSSHGLVIRIAVPAADLFSTERISVMRRLHEVASGVERFAVQAGFLGSRALAGGSCKTLFCPEDPDCPVLSDAGGCRFPASALMRVGGWPGDLVEQGQASGENALSWVAGLVMIREPS